MRPVHASWESLIAGFFSLTLAWRYSSMSFVVDFTV